MLKLIYLLILFRRCQYSHPLTVHGDMHGTWGHARHSGTWSAQGHMLSTGAHARHRFTCSTQGHMLGTGAHARHRGTCSAQGHMLDTGAHAQHRGTCSAQGHMLSTGSHAQHWGTCSTLGRMLGAGSHAGHWCSSRDFWVDIFCCCHISSVKMPGIFCKCTPHVLEAFYNCVCNYLWVLIMGIERSQHRNVFPIHCKLLLFQTNEVELYIKHPNLEETTDFFI